MPETEVISSERLNSLLIGLGRNLLQYAGESWLWSAANEQETGRKIEQLIADQRADAARIAECLDARGGASTSGPIPPSTRVCITCPWTICWIRWSTVSDRLFEPARI